MEDNDTNVNFFSDSSEVHSDSEVIAYRCRKCGTIFYSDNFEGTVTCVFCNNLLVESESITLEDEKAYFVPFEKTIEEAKSIYKKKVFFNPFIPFYFKSRKTIQNMKKIYVPSYFLDVHVEGDALFLAKDQNNIVQDKKKKIESKKYEVLFQTNFDYNNLVVCQFSKISYLFENTCSNQEYNMQECNLESLKGNTIIYQDLTAEDISNQLRERVFNTCLKNLRKAIQHEFKKIEQNNMTIQSTNVKKVFFPIYLLDVSYKEKDYYYIMNGVNGRAFAETYFGKGCIIAFCLFIFVLIILLSFLIINFL